MRRPLPLSLMACALCGVASGADDEATVVLHNGTRAAPGANLSYMHDRLVWHPYALIGVGWDNNPYQLPVADDADSFADWAVGTVVEAHPAVDTDLALCAALFQRRYSDSEGRDLSGGFVDARFNHEGPTTTLRGRLMADRSDDPLVETGRSIERDRVSGELQLIRPGARHRLEGSVRVGHVDYQEGGATFDEDERDRLQGEARVGVVRLLSETSEFGGRVTVLGNRYYADDTPYQDANGVRAEVTGKMRPTARVTLSGNGGYEFLAFDGPFAGDPDYDDERVSGPVAGLTVRWDLNSGTWLALIGSSRWIESSTSNAARLSGVEGAWQQRLGRRISLFSFAGVSQRQDADGGSDEAEDARENALGTGATIRLMPGLTTELRLRWREYLPSDAPGYDQLIVTGTVALVL